MYVDFKGQVGEPATDKLLDALHKKCRHTLVIDSKEVPWFPRHISQLDLIANRTLDAGQ
jgi:phenylalanine-4-hydroxylase